MGRGTRMLAGAAALAALVFGGLGWLLLGSVPGGAPAPSPGGDPGAPADDAAPAPAPAPPPDAPAGAPAPAPAGRGRIRGRLVRGSPPVPLPGSVLLAGKGVPALEAEAGADGRFELEGAPRGVFLSLAARAGGCLPATWPRILVPGAGSLDLGDLRLGPATSVDVTVRDGSDRPVPGAAVSLHRNPPGALGVQDWITPQVLVPPEPVAEARGVAGADGNLRIEGVPPGSYTVAAAAPGFARGLATTATAEDLPVPRVRLLLLPAARLEGTVSSHDGKLLAGIGVEGTPTSSGWGTTLATVAATSDAAGKWVLEGLPAGTLSLSVRPRPELRIHAATLKLPAVARYDIRLAEGAEIRGVVLDDATATPVPGASVTLQLWDPVGGTQAFARTLADGEGRFRLDMLPPLSTMGVAVRAEGFLPWPDAVGRSPGEQQALAPGSVKEVEARLRRGAAVAGRVADGAGKAVAAASVRLVAWTDTMGAVEGEPVRTDAGGNYRIENAIRGRSLVAVAAEGLHQVGYPANPWEAFRKGELPEAWTVAVPAEGEVRRDLVLAGGGSVEGTVLGPDGRPAAGIRVRVVGAAVVRGGGEAAPTDAEGGFLVRGAPPGEDLRVSATGTAGELGTSEPFRLDEGGTASGIRVELKGGSTLAGRIRREDGAALAGARLRLATGAPDGNQPWNWEWQKQSAVPHPVAADGGFRIEGLFPGQYTLLAAAEGTESVEGPVVEAAAGTVKDDVEILLRPGGEIAGRVVDARERPVAGAVLRVQKPAASNRAMWTGGQGVVEAVTGADGSFRLGGVGEGPLEVTARAPGYVEATAAAAAGKSDLVLLLREGGVLAGVVLDEGSGEPIPDLPVTAYPARPVPGASRANQPAATGPDGAFRLEGLDPDLDHNLVAGVQWGQGKSEYAPKTLGGLKPGATDLRILLSKGLPVSGRIVDEDGGPLSASFSLQLLGRKPDGSPDWSKNRWMQTAAPDGAFRMSGIEPGSYTLTVTASSGGAFAPAVLSPVEAGAEGLVVVMRRGIVVRGRVVDEHGETPAGLTAHVQYGLAGQPPNRSARTKPDGTFETEPLDPTVPLDFHVSGIRGFMGGTARGAVPAAGEVVIRLSRGGSIAGRVVDAEGRPAAGAVVQAIAEGSDGNLPGGRAGAAAKEDGTFLVEGLGEFRFRITGGGGGSAWQPATLPEPVAAGAVDVSIVVKPGVALAGRVVGADGSGKSVTLRAVPEGAAEGNPGIYTRSGTDGNFALRGLPPGKHRISAWVEGANQWTELGAFDAPGEGLLLTL